MIIVPVHNAKKGSQQNLSCFTTDARLFHQFYSPEGFFLILFYYIDDYAMYGWHGDKTAVVVLSPPALYKKSIFLISHRDWRYPFLSAHLAAIRVPTEAS